MADIAQDREGERLAALDGYDVLDTPREEAFDRITRLVRSALHVPIATVTFVDGHRQWIKSLSGGWSSPETARELSLCSRVVEIGETLVVPDTLADPRFSGNPFVTGEPHVRFYAAIPLRTHHGHTIGTLCAVDTRPRELSPDELGILADLGQIAMSELELRRLASTDALTGALSRRAFREEANRAVALALRHQHDLSCIVLDLDHFRPLNETHGKPFGDAVLARVGAICLHILRKSDVLGRIGGEEFAGLAPHAGRKAALDVAEKLRTAIAAETFAAPNGDSVSLTASFGIAALDKSMPDIDALLKNAEGALASAKAEGRNRIVAWQAPEPERSSVRRRVFKAGRITFNQRNSAIDCTIRTLSETGAGIDVFTTAGIPKSFELLIDGESRVRPTLVVEQTEKHLEVKFA